MSNQEFNLLTTKGIKLDNPATFESFVKQAKELQNILEEAWGAVEQKMLDHDVKSIKGDWGSLTIAERKNWKGDKLPPRFYKQVLNTAKLNSMLKLGEKLPKGASYTTSQYLTKKIK